MRTAVCISGLPREINETWSSLQDNLLAHMPNPDVFIFSGQEYPVDNKFFETIKPKKYVIEPQNKFTKIEAMIKSIGYHGADEHINSLIQQFYGLKRVFMLKESYEKESGVHYDLVIRTRPDFIYLRPITLDLIELNGFNTLHASFAPTMTTEFAIGSNDIMKKYFGIFDWLSDHTSKKYLNKNNPRLKIWDKELYTGDIIMTTYLLDFMGVKRAEQKLPASHPCPYMYYRIMHLHKMGNIYGPENLA